MTTKDYETIAACIKAELQARQDPIRNGGVILNDYILAASTALESLTYRFSDTLQIDNPKFNRSKFERACGF